MQRLQEAWVERLAFGPSPLVDRLAQLWMGVFPVPWNGVPNPAALWAQIASIRSHQGGRYEDLLLAMVSDPALLHSLDGLRSRRGNPNENLARELLELFSLGEGHYQQRDVQEAARALSGYRLQPDGTVALDPRLHDDGLKTILGRTERFDAVSLVRLLVQQEATAYTISGRLWRQLVGPLPSEQRRRKLARAWQQQNLDLPWLYRTLLQSPEATASIKMGGMIRDPIDLMVASLSLLGSRHPDALGVARLHLERMGQVPFAPPNVKGWPVDEGWLNLRWLNARRQGLNVLLADAEVWEGRQLPDSLSPALVPRQPLGLSLPTASTRTHLAALWIDPVWQLK